MKWRVHSRVGVEHQVSSNVHRSTTTALGGQTLGPSCDMITDCGRSPGAPFVLLHHRYPLRPRQPQTSDTSHAV